MIKYNVVKWDESIMIDLSCSDNTMIFRKFDREKLFASVSHLKKNWHFSGINKIKIEKFKRLTNYTERIKRGQIREGYKKNFKLENLPPEIRIWSKI